MAESLVPASGAIPMTRSAVAGEVLVQGNAVRGPAEQLCERGLPLLDRRPSHVLAVELAASGALGQDAKTVVLDLVIQPGPAGGALAARQV
jgi:hypothetical protein